MNWWAIFLTGLTTGGLSCLAMQGGLLAGVIANQKERELGEAEEGAGGERQKKLLGMFDQLDWLPVGLFLVTKLIAHIILGFFLGWLGSWLQLTDTWRLIFQGLAAVFMLAAAANLLDLHPIFRYLVLQPPRWVRRLLKNQTQSQAVFTPAVLGVLTVLVPCGVTQSMEVLAISSGNPVQGALIMGLFVLGTSPIFAVVGVATARLSEKFREAFLKVAAVTLIFLGLSGLNGILTVLDAPVTWQKVSGAVVNFYAGGAVDQSLSAEPTAVGSVQNVVIRVGNNGYNPKKVRVKAGVPVQLTLTAQNSYSCANWFTLPEFGLKAELEPTDTKTFTFTPTEAGRFTYTCSMGMYTGVLEVVK